MIVSSVLYLKHSPYHIQFSYHMHMFIHSKEFKIYYINNEYIHITGLASKSQVKKANRSGCF